VLGLPLCTLKMFHRSSRAAAVDEEEYEEVEWPLPGEGRRAGRADVVSGLSESVGGDRRHHDGGEASAPGDDHRGGSGAMEHVSGLSQGESAAGGDFVAPDEANFVHDVADAVAAMAGSSSDSDGSSATGRTTSEASASPPGSPGASSSDSAELLERDAPPSSPQPDLSAVTAARRSPFSKLEHLFSYLLLRGQTTVTEAAYEIVRAFHNGRVGAIAGSTWRSMRLPSTYTVRNKIAPRVRAELGLPVKTIVVQVNAAAEPVAVDVILPSDHVRRDFKWRGTYELFNHAGARSAEERRWHPEFVDSRFCRGRAEVLGAGPELHAFVVDGIPLRRGDVVDVSLADGAVVTSLTVGAGAFAGRGAGVRPDECVHAGDFTFPCSKGGHNVGVLNARHWLPIKHGPISWHVEGKPTLKVNSVALVRSPSRAAEARMLDGGGPLPGMEYIGDDHMPTFVLSLAFFLDDFVCRMGRSASVGGVYMLYLSWLFRHRTSRSAVRPIGLAAPEVDSDLFLEAISDDLVEGATVGWVIQDPDGRQVRVFADVALFIGDYKQVSKTTHLMGHRANAPCPLCSFTKPRNESSFYAGKQSSREAALMRTTARTLAVVGAVQDVLNGANDGEQDGVMNVDSTSEDST